tara:strand:- start:1625 stop:1771 length:147 start_codon:yes stop_codon:yes gene_type:complete
MERSWSVTIKIEKVVDVEDETKEGAEEYIRQYVKSFIDFHEDVEIEAE